MGVSTSRNRSRSFTLGQTTDAIKRVTGLAADIVIPNPVKHLETVLADRMGRPSQEAVLAATSRCFLAGQLSSAIPLLLRAYHSKVIWKVVAEAIGGDIVPRQKALELLLKPCPKTGSTILHHGRWLLSGGGQHFAALLDFLQAEEANLDKLMTLNDERQHPLYVAMSQHSTSTGDDAMQIMRRVSPELLWSEVVGFRGQPSTALHAACSPRFSEEEISELLERVPLDVVASARGPHGRTPILQAAASRAEAWVAAMLDRLPDEALGAVDDNGCSLVHLMCFLPDSLHERILRLVPDVEVLCSGAAQIDENCMRCTGNAAVWHMKRTGGPFVAKLVSLTSDESLFSPEWLIGEFGNAKCSLLHIAAGRADVELCEAILSRVTEERRDALTQLDKSGNTPLHTLFEIPGNNGSPAYIYGRATLAQRTSRIVAIARHFLGLLTDDELQIKCGGRTSLEQLLVMMTTAREADTGLFAICEELVDRTPPELWPGTRRLLGHAVRISRYSSLQCQDQLSFVATLLGRATVGDFYETSSLFLDAMRNYPNAAVSRLLLDATPRDALTHPGNCIIQLCTMLAHETMSRSDLQGMMELLLEYVPPALVLESNGPRDSAPIVAAIRWGNVTAVAAMLAACPEVKTSQLQVGEERMTALALAERHNKVDVARLLQPFAKNALA